MQSEVSHRVALINSLREGLKHAELRLFCQPQVSHTGQLIGAEALIDMPRWQQTRRILELAQIAVAHRPRYRPHLDELEVAIPGISKAIVWVDTPLTDLASNDLQRRARLGLPLRYVVTREVSDYIQAHQLYAAPMG